MTYMIDIQSTRRHPAAIDRALTAAVHEALIHEAVADGAGLTILLTDDEYLRRLNNQYRGEDRATDVLSFPAGEAFPNAEEMALYLGDIAISWPYAERQAAAKGHETVAELQLLAVHGALHLLGYDHADEAEKTTMWSAQKAILQKLGLEQIQPTEDEYDD
jgi:probable rRNA maturation factor